MIVHVLTVHDAVLFDLIVTVYLFTVLEYVALYVTFHVTSANSGDHQAKA